MTAVNFRQHPPPASSSSGHSNGVGEEGVQLRDDCCAFADRRPNALHRAGTDVADRKQTMHIRLQRHWRPIGALKRLASVIEIVACQHETLVVERSAAVLEPSGG